jgi:hypothetical protein
VVGMDLGGGSGIRNMIIRGCSICATGTEPMGARAIVGSLGARHEVSVHAPSQPAITAQALKAMPMGPKRTQSIKTIPVIQRRRVRPIVSPLSEARNQTFSHIPTKTQLCSRFISACYLLFCDA